MDKKLINKTMSDYTQTGSYVITTEEKTTSDKNEEVVQDYKFVTTPITFEDQSNSCEETISQEEEKNFYKKAFETKGF